jgi:hypothetical protein
VRVWVGWIITTMRVCILGMGRRVGRRMGVVWRWVFSGSGYVGLMPVVLLDNIVLDWSCQGLPAVNDVLTHYINALLNISQRF